MDGAQFDTLIKRLATRPLTRSTALRGLAASVAALAGVTLVAEPGLAGTKKRKFCHCGDETSTSCRTLKKAKSKAKKHLKKHDCDYKGKCQGFSGCAFADGQACTSSTQCRSGFCGDGICRPTGSCQVLTTTCSTSGQCCSGNCQGTCVPCKSNGTTCAVDSECCSGNCVGGMTGCAPAP